MGTFSFTQDKLKRISCEAHRLTENALSADTFENT
jgi:hypothetical protein